MSTFGGAIFGVVMVGGRTTVTARAVKHSGGHVVLDLGESRFVFSSAPRNMTQRHKRNGMFLNVRTRVLGDVSCGVDGRNRGRVRDSPEFLSYSGGVKT